MRGLRSIVCTVFFLACAGAVDESLDEGVRDAPGLEVHLLPDALVLEPGATDFSPPGPAEDSGFALPPDASFDPYPADARFPSDDGPAQDPANPLDAPPLSDPGIPEDKGEMPIAGWCGPDGTICPPGSSCLPDDKTGTPRCRFVAECSGHGAIDVEDILDIVFTTNSIYVKVKARAWVGPAACTMIPCPADSPCCNACFAPLVVGDQKFPIVLLGQGVTFGCEGSECDYSLACSPLKPGARYWIWGTLSLIGGEVQFFVDSFCPAPEH